MSLAMPTTSTATSATAEPAPEDSAPAPTARRARKSPEETMAELKAKRKARDEEEAKAMDSAGSAMGTAGSSLTSLSGTVATWNGSSAAKSTLEGLDLSGMDGGVLATGAVPAMSSAPVTLPSAPTTGAPTGGGSAGAVVGLVSAAFQLGGAACKVAAASKRSEGEDTAGMVMAGVNGGVSAVGGYVGGTQLDEATQNAYNSKVTPYQNAADEVALCDKNKLQTQRLMDQGKMSQEEGTAELSRLTTQRDEAYARGARLADHKQPKEKKAPKEKEALAPQDAASLANGETSDA